MNSPPQTDAQNFKDPEIRELFEAQRRTKERYLAGKALGMEIIPLQINGRNISEELRDLMELEVIRILGLPSDFYDIFPTDPSTPITKRFGISTVEPDSLEEEDSSPKSNDPLKVGSIGGIPGVHFPDYTDIPITSFSCADKPHLPGFYADLDTGCQVFHVCWNNRRETFLCPMGTTFNQPLLACDYWYSSNCSLALNYFNVNEGKKFLDEVPVKDDLRSMIDVFLGSKTNKSKSLDQLEEDSIPASVLSFVTQFMPVKAKVTLYPESGGQLSKIVASASIGSNKSTLKANSLRTTESSSIKTTSSSNTNDKSSEIPTWCISYRNFAYRLDEKLNAVINWLKKEMPSKELEMDIVAIRKFIRYLDPEFDKFNFVDANYATEKQIRDFLSFLRSMANSLLPDIGIGPTSTEYPEYPDLLELFLEKFRKLYLLLNPETGISDPKKKDTTTSEYDGVSTTTPLTPIDEVSRCKKPKCESRAKPTLTPLNPRFITKAIAPKLVAVTNERSYPPRKQTVSKPLVKKTVLYPSSSKHVSVAEETKKALLLNYMKLLKINGKKML